MKTPSPEADPETPVRDDSPADAGTPTAAVLLDLDPALLAAPLLGHDRRVLLLGESGIGKSTLARALAAELGVLGRRTMCLAADPGSPAFGVPGALALGRWRSGGWSPVRVEALCTLDAGRFRLPLVAAASALVREPVEGTLLVDTPGLVRGVAGAELLESLVRLAAIDLVLVLCRKGEPPPLSRELANLGVEVALVRASPGARSPNRAQRARARTALWDGYLAGGTEHWVPLRRCRLLGTPPRRAPEAWIGKQIAFLEGGRTRSLGEALAFEGGRLRIRLPAGPLPTDTLLVRDATRGRDGLLATGKPFAADSVRHFPPPDLLPDANLAPSTGTRPMVQVGLAIATLLNGVFDDPLLHLRLRHQRRSLLFDLGEGARLPARIAHQVSDCFVTHAHADHIGGFLWLLRSRIGEPGLCRLFGPPGLAGHLHGFASGILWDRIGDKGPVFEVAELQGERLCRFRLQAGRGDLERLPDLPAPLGVLRDEPGFRVRCVVLEHGTPVLAFAYEPKVQVKVRAERLEALGLRAGPWLTGLKQRILKGDLESEIELPDGSRRQVAGLAAELTSTVPAARLVYATDFADTPGNRRRIVALAAGAHTFFCEASFLAGDVEQAERTGHLTARACGEIAAEAGVERLIPFHFSRRYEEAPWRVYEEVAAACPQTVIPKGGA